MKRPHNLLILFILLCGLTALSAAQDYNSPFTTELHQRGNNSLGKALSSLSTSPIDHVVTLRLRVPGCRRAQLRLFNIETTRTRRFLESSSGMQFDPIDVSYVNGKIGCGSATRSFPVFGTLITERKKEASRSQINFTFSMARSGKRRPSTYRVRARLNERNKLKGRVKRVRKSKLDFLKNSIFSILETNEPESTAANKGKSNNNGPLRDIRIATQADYSFYKRYGSMSNAVIAEIFNMANASIASELGVHLVLKEQYVSTNPSTSLTVKRTKRSASSLLAAYSEKANALAEQVDVLHVFSGSKFRDRSKAAVFENSICSSKAMMLTTPRRNFAEMAEMISFGTDRILGNKRTDCLIRNSSQVAGELNLPDPVPNSFPAGTIEEDKADVAAYVLVDSDTDQQIFVISDGSIYSDIPADSVNMVAVAAGKVPAAMVFRLEVETEDSTSVWFNTERVAPYAMFRDNVGDFYGWPLRVGNYTLYTQAWETLDVPGPIRGVNFGVREIAPPPPPVPPTTGEGCGAIQSQNFDPRQSIPAPEQAATVQVSSLADSGAGSLRQAVADAPAGAVIGFAAGQTGTVQLGSQITINKNLTIQLGNVTLDAQGQSRHFFVERGVSLALHGGVLQNGFAADGPGGAIQVDQNGSHLKAVGTSFINNDGFVGGAVRIGYESTSEFDHCYFSGNVGSRGQDGFSAGAISTYGTGDLMVKNSRFENNRGWLAGAVYNLLGTIEVQKSVFISNRAESDAGAGALFSDGGNNVGPGNTEVDGKMIVTGSWFEDNLGFLDSGAVFLWGYPRDYIEVSDSVFVGNEVQRGKFNGAQGGGIRVHNEHEFLLTRSSFIENVSHHQGGAAWLDGGGLHTIENTFFGRNRVLDDAGGAIVFNTNGPIRVNHTTFSENFSNRACGAFWIGSPDTDIVVSNSIFNSNTAGDPSQNQVGYAPMDGGGNFEFPAPSSGARPVAATAQVADPLFGELQVVDGFPLQVPSAQSPLIDAAGGTTQVDIRGAVRTAPADVGAVEAGAQCPAQ